MINGVAFDLDGLLIDSESLWAEIHKSVFSEYTTTIRCMEGALELVDTLFPCYPLVLVTYSPRESAEITCAHFNIADKLKLMITRHDTANQKPHPEPYLKAAELVGFDPSEIVAFEDASKGVVSAKNAGMKCVAVPVRSLREIGLDTLRSI